MYAPDDPPPLASSHLRIARPSRDLARAERFWVSGLGLRVLERIQPQGRGEHELVILVAWRCLAPGVCQRSGRPYPAAPTVEDLIVLYFGQPAGPALIQRMVTEGGRVVPARNPHRDRRGITIADPDGYRLVLSHRTWQ